MRKRVITVLVAAVACGPTVPDDGADGASAGGSSAGASPSTSDTSTASSSESEGDDGVIAFAVIDANGQLKIHLTNSPYPTCEEPFKNGDWDYVTKCPPGELWSVQLSVDAPFEVPGRYTDPDTLDVYEATWSGDETSCGFGAGGGIPGAALDLHAMTDDTVDGSASFMVFGEIVEVTFSASICP